MKQSHVITTSTIGQPVIFNDENSEARIPSCDADGVVNVNVLSGGSSGTQYTEGDTDTTITGTVAMAEGPGDTLEALQVDSSKHLQVDIAADSVGIGGGTQFDDGDTIDTDSQGTLMIATTGISGTARAVRCEDDGAVHISDGGDTISVDDGGGALTVDGTVTANAGTGTFNVDVTANTAGLATSANQLPDGHNVTVDNATGASAVNIQDGGNSITIDDGGSSITVDGTVTANAGTGTFNVDVTANSIGLATSANQLPDGHNVTVDNASGASAVNIQDGGNSITVDDGGGSLTVDGSVSVSAVTPGTSATSLGKAEDAAHSSGDTGVMALGVRNEANATLSGTNLDYTPIAVNSEGSVRIVGSRAHDAAVQGNPVLTGFESRTSNPTAVGNGDAVRAMADDVGRQVVVPHQVRDLTTHAHTAITTTSETTILSAGGAGVFHDLVMLIITNEDHQSVQVTIKDSTSGTTRMIIQLAPKGGASLPFPVPVTQATANNNWTATLDVNPDNNVNFFVQAVKNV